MERPRYSFPSEGFPPEPTIFLQATPENFRELVQRYTGVTTAPSFVRPNDAATNHSIDNLQNRRPTMRKLEINVDFARVPIPPQFHCLRYHCPWLPLPPPTPKWNHPSPMTPLSPGALSSPAEMTDEERAIAEKGFYLYPSLPRVKPPKLLQLFPLTPSGSSSDDEEKGDCKGKKDQA